MAVTPINTTSTTSVSSYSCLYCGANTSSSLGHCTCIYTQAAQQQTAMQQYAAAQANRANQTAPLTHTTTGTGMGTLIGSISGVGYSSTPPPFSLAQEERILQLFQMALDKFVGNR